MFYKIIFYDETNVKSHEINFLKKFGTLYGLLINLLTSKTNRTNTSIDQIAFTAYLLMGYYDKKLFIEKAEVSKTKSGFWQSKAFSMEKIIYNSSRKIPLRSIKFFFSKNFKEGTTKEQKAVLLNAVKLYDGTSKIIIRLFENKDIKPNDYPHNAKSELDEHDRVEEFKPKKSDGVEKSKRKSVESIAERVKSRRQKSDELKKMITENDKIIRKELFKNCFQFQSLCDMQKKIV